MADLQVSEFSAKEVAGHRDAKDAWMVIHGEVFDVSKYLHDHPGGADVLVEAAGTDATEAFDNAGHSEDAYEIMAEYRVGKLKGATKKAAPKAVRLQPPPSSKSSSSSKTSSVPKTVGAGALALTVGSLGVYYAAQLASQNGRLALPRLNLPLAEFLHSGAGTAKPTTGGFGFLEGFLLASAVFGAAGTVAAKKLMGLIHFSEGFAGFPAHVKLPPRVAPDPLQQRGWLDPVVFQALPLTKKELIAPNTYRFVFELPTPTTVLGLPIGQHVSIKADDIDSGGKGVQRSYTPVSNNADRGVLELVIKCYPDGLLTGRYLAHLKVGDEVQFRGPKGAMRYRRNLCRRIGMLAGGTGITPMYQVIRAICEDPRDVTEVSLVYANRSEDDILLRAELEAFARRYPRNLKIYYTLDSPPATGWAGGVGFVTKDVMADRFPRPDEDAKVMICGPPGMVNAAKKGLVELGYRKPGAMSKMEDQIFCF